MPLQINRIEQTLSAYQPQAHTLPPGTRQAAVAAILREVDGHTEALFILRATKDGDPWSGHMAFPGGHREPEDQTLQQTAERETFEEIGLDLNLHGRYLGVTEPVDANPRGRQFRMQVTPYFYLLESEPTYKPNYEVADILWGSLNLMHSGHSLTESAFHVAGQKQYFKGYEVGSEVVWGLTMRMLSEFFLILDPQWRSHY